MRPMAAQMESKLRKSFKLLLMTHLELLEPDIDLVLTSVLDSAERTEPIAIQIAVTATNTRRLS
jgi:hypothetical protein